MATECIDKEDKMTMGENQLDEMLVTFDIFSDILDIDKGEKMDKLLLNRENK